MVENFHAVLAMSGGRFRFRRFPFPPIPAGLSPPNEWRPLASKAGKKWATRYTPWN